MHTIKKRLHGVAERAHSFFRCLRRCLREHGEEHRPEALSKRLRRLVDRLVREDDVLALISMEHLEKATERVEERLRADSFPDCLLPPDDILPFRVAHGAVLRMKQVLRGRL